MKERAKGLFGAALLAMAFAASAQPVSLRPELVPPLRAAQELLQQKKFAEALAALAPADAVADKSPQETWTLERLRAAAASGAGDVPMTIRALDAALGSGLAPPAEQPALLEALVNANLGQKRYAEAAQAARRYLQLAPSPAMRSQLAQALYQGADFQGAAAEALVLVQSGNPPAKGHLDLLAASYAQLKDEARYTGVLEQLVTFYPSRDHWADLLVRIERSPGFDRRFAVDLFRLQFAANAMLEGADYLELAQMTLDAGYPAESAKVMEAGYATGVLGGGPDAEKHQRFRQQVAQRAQDQLKALDAAALPAQAEALFQHGYALYTQGRVQPGLAAMQQAVDKGGLAREGEARLRLGFAQGRAGNPARAVELLSEVQAAQAADGSADIARLSKLLSK
ncbi:MAG: hypothetical protein ABW051_07850 [Burkholderiaceae bacterium]